MTRILMCTCKAKDTNSNNIDTNYCTLQLTVYIEKVQSACLDLVGYLER